MLENIRAKVDGYKVYIVGVAGVLGAIAAWAAGSISPVDAIKLIWGAALAMAGRSALAKATPQ